MIGQSADGTTKRIGCPVRGKRGYHCSRQECSSCSWVEHPEESLYPTGSLEQQSRHQTATQHVPDAGSIRLFHGNLHADNRFHSLLLRHLYRPHAGTTLRRIYTGRSGVQDTRLFRFHGQACIQLQSDRRCHSSAQRRHTEPLQQFSGGFRPGTASRCGIHVWTVTAENALCRSKIHDVTSGTSQPIPRFIWWDR